jgi:hypothetical protein
MKKLIEKIRVAKTWQARVKIAQDKLPGTFFDPVFEEAQLAADMETKYRPITRQCHELMGKWLAARILKGETQVLHALADALAKLKRHKPKRNYELEVLSRLGEKLGQRFFRKISSGLHFDSFWHARCKRNAGYEGKPCKD